MAREQAIKDVMSLFTEEEHRGKLMMYAIDNTIDNILSFVDILVLFSLLVKTGHADVDKPEEFKIRYEHPDVVIVEFYQGDVKVDNDGRICDLDLGTHESDSYHVRAGFLRHFTKLTQFRMKKCLSLSEEVQNLPHLQNLSFHCCSGDIFDNFPIEMKLDKLKKLRLDSCEFKSSSLLLFTTWMPTQIPNLEHLGAHFDF
jgi:hypothetical protein